ncbi:MAG: cold shock domain-containing protein [Bdellovibrionales bacterium]|nr:cold shock domain-containing protein [Bdellovibrionales bacterium]
MAIRWQVGTVRWFNEASGLGIIEDDAGRTYEVHYSAIQSDKKWKTLHENKKVRFIPLDDPDYMIAEQVKEVA